MILGLICSISSDYFWYNACLKCYSKVSKQKQQCQACNAAQCFTRYRLSCAVETGFGIKNITLFGPVLNQHFGVEVDVLVRWVEQDVAGHFPLLQDAASCYFVGKSCHFANESFQSEQFVMEESHLSIIEIIQHTSVKNQAEKQHDKNKKTSRFSAKFDESVNPMGRSIATVSQCLEFDNTEFETTDLDSVGIAVLPTQYNPTPLEYFDRNKTAISSFMFVSPDVCDNEVEPTQEESKCEISFDETMPVYRSADSENEEDGKTTRQDYYQHDPDCPPIRRTKMMRKIHDEETESKKQICMLSKSVLKSMDESFDIIETLPKCTNPTNKLVPTALLTDCSHNTDCEINEDDSDGISSSFELFDDSL